MFLYIYNLSLYYSQASLTIEPYNQKLITLHIIYNSQLNGASCQINNQHILNIREIKQILMTNELTIEIVNMHP